MSDRSDVSAPAAVLLFDGECGLCGRVVDWLVRIDARGTLRFARLQGPAAQEVLRAHGLPADDFDSLVFVPDWSRRLDPAAAVALRTDGVIAALRAVGARRRAACLEWWPRSVRDFGYRFVARWRQRIFGAAAGRPASAGEPGRFLD